MNGNVRITLRCGEVYDFFNVKSIEHNADGLTIIVGNYRPSGKYHTVKVFTDSIARWGY